MKRQHLGVRKTYLVRSTGVSFIGEVARATQRLTHGA